MSSLGKKCFKTCCKSLTKTVLCGYSLSLYLSAVLIILSCPHSPSLSLLSLIFLHCSYGTSYSFTASFWTYYPLLFCIFLHCSSLSFTIFIVLLLSLYSYFVFYCPDAPFVIVLCSYRSLSSLILICL